MSRIYTKPSEGKFKWSQTAESLSISLPVKNVLMKHVEVLYTDLVLKVNVPKIKYVQVIDFPFAIEFESLSNKVTLTDDCLEIYLMKVIPEQWSELQFTGISGPELTLRRNDSLDQYYALQAEKKKAAIQKTYDLDKHVIQSQMKVETHQRDMINSKRQEQKSEFEKDLSDDLAKMESSNKVVEKQKQENLRLHEGERYKSNTKNTSMFDDEDIEEINTPGVESSRTSEPIFEEEPEIEEVEVPKVRESVKTDLGFTEKKFAHLPARES